MAMTNEVSSEPGRARSRDGLPRAMARITMSSVPVEDGPGVDL